MNKETLKVGDNRIAVYQSAGTGPAAMLIHGNSSSARVFRQQLEGDLGDTFRLAAIDLPGHGESAPAADPAADYTLPGYTRVVTGVAQQLGLMDAVFVGWSLGGHILLEAADQLPDTKGLLILGTPPVGLPPAMEQAFLPNPAMAAAFAPELTEEQIAGFAAAFFKPGAAVDAMFLEDIRRTDGQARAVMGGSIGTGGYKDEIEVVANLTVPLAVLHGEQEQLINGAYISGLTMPTLWRGAVQIIPGAGHTPQWEQPERFNALLEAFLRETA